MGQAKEPQDVWPEGETALVTLFRHNLWANLRLLDACAALDAAQLDEAVTGTYGAIYDTLNHLVRAEQGYLIQLTGQYPELRLRRTDRPSLDTLRAQARLSGVGLMAVAGTIAPSAMATWEDENGRWAIAAGVVLTQAINHATEHRAQIATTLAQIGVTPPEMDGWVFGYPYATLTPNES